MSSSKFTTKTLRGSLCLELLNKFLNSPLVAIAIQFANNILLPTLPLPTNTVTLAFGIIGSHSHSTDLVITLLAFIIDLSILEFVFCFTFTLLSPFVFPNSNGEAKSLTNLRRSLRAAIKDEGSLNGIKLYDIRNTVTTAIEREYGIKPASIQAGHSSTKITEKYYVERIQRSQNIEDAIKSLV